MPGESFAIMTLRGKFILTNRCSQLQYTYLRINYDTKSGYCDYASYWVKAVLNPSLTITERGFFFSCIGSSRLYITPFIAGILRNRVKPRLLTVPMIRVDRGCGKSAAASCNLTYSVFVLKLTCETSKAGV